MTLKQRIVHVLKCVGLALAFLAVYGASLAVYGYFEPRLLGTRYGDVAAAIAALVFIFGGIVALTGAAFALKEAFWSPPGPVELLEAELRRNEPKPKETFGDRVKVIAGFALMLLMLIGLFYALSLRHKTLKPGESIDMRLEGLGVIVSAEASPSFVWTDDDTRAISVRSDPVDGIQLSLVSVDAKVSTIGKVQKMVGIESVLHVEALPGAQPADLVIPVWFVHAKLQPPTVSHVPVERLRLRIERR